LWQIEPLEAKSLPLDPTTFQNGSPKHVKLSFELHFSVQTISVSIQNDDM
jgi:hypothetical protein